LGFHFCF